MPDFSVDYQASPTPKSVEFGSDVLISFRSFDPPSGDAPEVVHVDAISPRVSFARLLAALPPDVLWEQAMILGPQFIGQLAERCGPEWREALEV